MSYLKMTEFETNELISNEYFVIRGIAARYLDLTSEELDELSRDEDWWVRHHIAERDDLTAEQVERLSQDEDEYVRRAIERNPHAQMLLGEKKKKRQGLKLRPTFLLHS